MKPLLLFFLMATTGLSCQTPVTEVIFHPHEDTVVYQQEPNPVKAGIKTKCGFPRACYLTGNSRFGKLVVSTAILNSR